eukprot:CAMPEP_0204222012 /NCGR_PEP_ID=MMETSP0361-20130328/81955_1 /ASSEMBLY_ACC=CAM_ASM_000343 /TAXON_ID=268821 /ORGANISM="Scrippsiella Hangoei, Strain SHTV-5" /LENGTH=34 /DNA_ID= /DNA_START= /DNA_END= /DNA_ORIENTATION=
MTTSTPMITTTIALPTATAAADRYDDAFALWEAL